MNTLSFLRSGLLGTSLVLLVLGSSCAVSMKMPGNHFQSSEVYGKTGLRLGGGAQGKMRVEFTSDLTLRAPETQNPLVESDRDLTAFGAFGLGERFEVQYTFPDLFTGKYQILGASKQDAEVGNLSLAVTTTLGWGKQENSETGVFDAKPYHSELSHFNYGLGLVGGYRFHERMNFYTGPFIDFASYDGHYGVTGVSTAKFSGQVRNRGAVFGLEVGKAPAVVMVEGAWNQTTTASAQKHAWVSGISAVFGF